MRPPAPPPMSDHEKRDAEEAFVQEAVRRVLDGDVEAFAVIVNTFRNLVAADLARRLPPSDVQEVAQDAFVRAYRALHQFRGDAQFYTWLYRIAVNTAKKALLELKRDPTVSEGALRSGDDGDETSWH